MDPELRWMQPSTACPVSSSVMRDREWIQSWDECGLPYLVQQAAHWWRARGMDPELGWMWPSSSCPAAQWWGSKGMDPELRWMWPSPTCPASRSLMRGKGNGSRVEMDVAFPYLSSKQLIDEDCGLSLLVQQLIDEGQREWIQSWDECGLPLLVQQAAHWWGLWPLPACPAAHWWGAKGIDPTL